MLSEKEKKMTSLRLFYSVPRKNKARNRNRWESVKIKFKQQCVLKKNLDK